MVGELGERRQRPAADALDERVDHGQADVGHRAREPCLDRAPDLRHAVDHRHRRAGRGADAAGQGSQEPHREGHGQTDGVGAELGRLPQHRLDVGGVGLRGARERPVAEPAGLLDGLDLGDEVGQGERSRIEGDDGPAEVAVDLDPVHGVERAQRRFELGGEVRQFRGRQEAQLEVGPLGVDPRPAGPAPHGAAERADEVEQAHQTDAGGLAGSMCRILRSGGKQCAHAAGK